MLLILAAFYFTAAKWKKCLVTSYQRQEKPLVCLLNILGDLYKLYRNV